jgi:hypothetical protein
MVTEIVISPSKIVASAIRLFRRDGAKARGFAVDFPQSIFL